MTDRAVLIREIDSLPSDHWDEVLELVEQLKRRPAPSGEPRQGQYPVTLPVMSESLSPEDAIKRAAEIRADPNRRPITDFFGICPGFLGGDGMAYQRQVREEWDD